MGNRVVHFEIEAKDPKKLSEFYEKALGWKMDVQGPELGNYVLINTGDGPVGINGGMFGNSQKQLNAYSCTIGVEDMGEIMDISGVGKYAKCTDPDGNHFTLLQPDMNGPYAPK